MKCTTCNDCGYMFRCMRCINADEDAVAAPVDPQLVRISELEAANAITSRALNDTTSELREALSRCQEMADALAAEKEGRRKADARILRLARHARNGGAAARCNGENWCMPPGLEVGDLDMTGEPARDIGPWGADLDAPKEGTTHKQEPCAAKRCAVCWPKGGGT